MRHANGPDHVAAEADLLEVGTSAWEALEKGIARSRPLANISDTIDEVLCRQAR